MCAVFFFTNIFLLPYKIVVISSFLITSLILFTFSYKYVFRETTNTVKKSFSIFWAFVFLKLCFAYLIINLLVDNFLIQPYVARFFSAVLESVFAFNFDYFFTFKIVKK